MTVTREPSRRVTVTREPTRRVTVTLNLDKTCIIVHINLVWHIIFIPEYEDWFTAQEEDSQIAINAKITEERDA